MQIMSTFHACASFLQANHVAASHDSAVTDSTVHGKSHHIPYHDNKTSFCFGSLLEQKKRRMHADSKTSTLVHVTTKLPRWERKCSVRASSLEKSCVPGAPLNPLLGGAIHDLRSLKIVSNRQQNAPEAHHMLVQRGYFSKFVKVAHNIPLSFPFSRAYERKRSITLSAELAVCSEQFTPGLPSP